ncbi:MAG: hypothetical protein CMJ76_03670 [Planctomycetaceae bacterium]|nr:hypothetical protein [Planctomycetaceae bacterium]|tara:strand:+ start:711 stop:1232 length:522 start_codon:yes stop_codon:yes gene_type:complete
MSQFSNDYELVNGFEMHEESPEHFHIPHDLLKKYLSVGQFVELRVDSPRFSSHPDAPQGCTCPVCNGEASKPIIGHPFPLSLINVQGDSLPSRGWGEDFWVQIVIRDGDQLQGRVDNHLYEKKLHEIEFNSIIDFTLDHVLAVHPIHREQLVLSMTPEEVKEFAVWLGTLRDD